MTQALSTPADLRRIRGLLTELGAEARRFRFEVAPNPAVGAAVLAGERVVARGFHRTWGEPHAEVDALERAALTEIPREEWDTLVVTLEPCSSRGKTPPCTDAILAAGIRNVVVGSLDPDARHRGRGIELLTEAGLEAELVPRAAPLEEVSPHFLEWTAPERGRRPRPWVVAKWAQTRTGQLTPPEDVGEGRWISSPDSLREVQGLRSRVDAIVTGVGTVLADDPRLTVRGEAHAEGPGTAPLRVVLDSVLRTPPGARLFAPLEPGESGGAVHVLTRLGTSPARHRALEEAGASVHGLRPSDGGLDLRAVTTWLWDQGARRVLLEAGPTLVAALLEAQLVDQVRVYTGEVNGGRGPSLGEWLRSDRLTDVEHRECGLDAVLEAFTARS